MAGAEGGAGSRALTVEGNFWMSKVVLLDTGPLGMVSHPTIEVVRVVSIVHATTNESWKALFSLATGSRNSRLKWGHGAAIVQIAWA